MNVPDEVDLWHTLYRLEARYWHEVDCNGGRKAHEFYLPDGVLVVGHNRFQGREKIREFYAWRERHCTTVISSVKTTRHLINNLIVDATTEGRARVLGVVSFYGSAARPPAQQSKPPMLIADALPFALYVAPLCFRCHAYDLVSLLQDARLDVPEQLELTLLTRYIKARRAADSQFDPAGFAELYAIMSAQRNTRLLGTFARLNRRDGKPQYLRHQLRIWTYLNRSLAHPALAAFRQWYAANVPPPVP